MYLVYQRLYVFLFHQKDLPQIKEQVLKAIDPDEWECSPLIEDDVIVHVSSLKEYVH